MDARKEGMWMPVRWKYCFVEEEGAGNKDRVVDDDGVIEDEGGQREGDRIPMGVKVPGVP
jgi:hypothetical protein